ncbi:MAG: oligosaccharide flippase family protein [Rhodospirillales bacterium]|nr:oligosaccharide flippase family protein [Rhodospirillales bacterium]
MKGGQSLLALASAIVSRSSSLVVLIFSSQLLSADEFGVFALLMVIAGVINAMVSGGGDMWLNRFTWRQGSEAQRVPRLWFMYIFLCCGLAFSIIALAALIAFGLESSPAMARTIFLAVLAAAIAGLFEAMLAVARASGSVAFFFTLRDLIVPLALVALLALFAPTKAADIFALWAGLSMSALILVSILMFGRAARATPNIRIRRVALQRLTMHTAGLIYGNLLARLATYIDVLVLAYFVPLSYIGGYRIAAQFTIGFIVIQHFLFLGLPWQLRHVGAGSTAGAGRPAVLQRQIMLIGLSVFGLACVWIGGGLLLGLIDPRFAALALVFKLLATVRFADLLWGPQHETLVSRGFVMADAQANLGALIGFGIVFAALIAVSPPAAAVAGSAAAALVVQTLRNRMLLKNDIMPVVGHPFGPYLPVPIYVGVAAVAIWTL